MKLPNKVALITGSGSGMGRASAVLFSKEGAKISIVDLDEKAGQETVEMIEEKGVGPSLFGPMSPKQLTWKR